ncbi:unnamed protein product [Tenebrio molitor]|nr:unnamed protein product [Tenebrio molitor]
MPLFFSLVAFQGRVNVIVCGCALCFRYAATPTSCYKHL